MAQYNNSQCWMPDSITILEDLVPCDPSAPVTVCCTFGESCTVNGYCYGSAGTFYRGGCTDKTWTDGACPKRCIGADPNDGYASEVTFLSVCQWNAGGPPIWTCDFGGCDDKNFTLGMGAILQRNITGNVTTGAEMKTATATIIASPPTNEHDVTTVGAAVGVPLGVAFLIAIGCVIFLLKKKKHGARQNLQGYHGSDVHKEQHVEPIRKPELPDEQRPAELYHH